MNRIRSIAVDASVFEPLDRAALRRVLTEPKNAIIRQYIKLFEMDGIMLTFDDDALELIVDKAIEYKLGARGLRSIVETVMTDAMFETPGKDVKTFAVTRAFSCALRRMRAAANACPAARARSACWRF